MMSNKPFAQLSKLRQNKRLLFVLILSLVAVFFWVIVSIASTRQERIVSPELNKLAQSLVPALDQKVFESVKEKRFFEADELQNFSIFIVSETEQGVWQLIDVINQKKATIIQGKEEAVFMQESETGGLSELIDNQVGSEASATE